MNPGILTTGYASPQMPYGLLGVPQPVPMVDPRREPNWRIVGSSVWSLYRSSILRTMRTAAVRDTLTTPSGSSYSGSSAYSGGVLLPDGRVFCVPASATTARIYGGGRSFDVNVLLSAYFNKF